jgi:AraC-like DNA-binding protein
LRRRGSACLAARGSEQGPELAAGRSELHRHGDAHAGGHSAAVSALGGQLVDAVVDLGGIIGDAAARRLLADATAACSPDRIASVLDQWFALRLERSKVPNELQAFAAAMVAIGRGANVDAAARIAGISPRQLERWCGAHMGVGPKRLAVLHRLQLSLSTVQRSQGEPLAGFSDQAHQIRTWRRYVGVTPGRYARTPASRLSAAFSENVEADREPLAFYL